MRTMVYRFGCGEKSTLGALSIDGKFECFTMEPPMFSEHGPVCIVGGIYQWGLDLTSGIHEDYLIRFPDIEIGALTVMAVPDRDDIRMHIGNKVEETLGCLMTGETCEGNNGRPGKMINSKVAFLKAYKKISRAVVDSGADLLIGSATELIKFNPSGGGERGRI